MHLGFPWPQNKYGHVLGDVTDQNKAPDDPTSRGNEIGGMALPFHCDGSDLVGLMCLANGRRGGLSAVANSVRIHNQLVRERPDLAEVLYGPYPYDFRGEQAARRPSVLRAARVHRVGRPAVRALHPAVHPRLPAPRRRAAPLAAAGGGAAGGRAAWPTIPRTTC